MKVWAIGMSNIKRMIRERSNIFFVFIFPIAIILLIGAQFGGGVNQVVGVYAADDGSIATAVVEALEGIDDIDVRSYAGEDELITAVEEGAAQAGVSLPAAMEDTAAAGEPVEIGYVSRTDGTGPQLQAVVGAVVADVMKPVGAARFAAVETGAPFDQTLGIAIEIAEGAPEIGVQVMAVGESLFPDTLGQFDLGASSQLVLFTFLTALAGSAALILTRQLGISQRMLSTPTSLGQIVVGESVGRFGTAMVQGVYIIVLTLIIFQVNWGDPIGATLLLIVFSAVGAAAGVLMGSVFSNDQQASGVGVMLSIGLGALGGCMLPLELFSPTMQQVAHITPHAWALDGYAELVRRGGNTLDILPELGVLVTYAAVLFALAAWRLRVAITRP
ncbi:MAG TPA: ABC transporter permease [Acidimicrobiia bacterium]|nr:ABC transporter permease [Acidimicrobiia bacterium]